MLKDQLKNKMKVHNFKVKEQDLELIRKNANRYADGNVSHWIRHAALNHIPKNKHLVAPKAEKK